MIQIHDIIKIELTPARVQHLLSGGSESQRLAHHNGAVMRVGGIQHLQEPEELRTYVLEDLMYPYPPYVYAPRADITFIRHGEPRKREAVAPVLSQPAPVPRQQLSLFVEAE